MTKNLSFPKNNLASMGIYIFNWSLLKEYLEMDDRNPDSSHDFGKDVIPLLLEEKKKLMAYPFQGYWKDVGTVKSLWEANMDLLTMNATLTCLIRNGGFILLIQISLRNISLKMQWWKAR